jgi:hypothetical protein
MAMTIGENSIKLPDGEELVVIDRADWLVTTLGPDPREGALDVRRQVSASVEVLRTPLAPTVPSAT